jgi:hypothetical protein
MKLEATSMGGRKWLVRPAGALGNCGWIDGKPWTAKTITARDASEAVRKASA